LYSYLGHKKTITGAHFLNDGKHFVTVSNDGTVKGWAILAAREHQKAMEDKNGEGKPPTPIPIYTTNAHPGSLITASALSPDAKLLATGSGEGIVRLWEAANGKGAGNLEVAHRGGTKALAFHPEGKWLATAGADKTVKLWELGVKPKVVKTFTEHEGAVNALSFSPDGKFLAAGTGVPKKSGSIKVWNLETAKVAYTLEGHEDVVTAVLFHPKEAYLASGDALGKIRAWDIEDKKTLYTDEHAEGVRGMIIASDASRFGTFSGPTARWWKAFGK
jgi:WD40 repeat protein